MTPLSRREILIGSGKSLAAILAASILPPGGISALAADDPAFAAIAPIVVDEIALGHFPGAVVVVAKDDAILYRRAFGNRMLVPETAPMLPDTIFDLASLTKMVATLPAILQLLAAGRLALDDKVAKHWPGFGANGKSAITIEQLLTHASGLRPDIDERAPWQGEGGALAWIVQDHPIHPPGTEFLYSDINFMVLGALVERISGLPLARYCREKVFAPLGMRETGFLPDPALRPSIAPTDIQGSGLRWGAVQDTIAARMGGVAGHAGVFSTADDLVRYARMILGGGALDGTRVLSEAWCGRMMAPHVVPGGFVPNSVVRGLGWDMSSLYSSGMDHAFGMGSFGHTGYTGTSLWIDPASRVTFIVLTSRLHPRARGDAVPVRKRLAPVIATATFPSDLLTGIDVLADERFAPMAGLKLGLVTNNSGRDRQGNRTIDVMAGTDRLHLGAIFAPEHGLESNREGKIDSGHEAATGLPLYSLYGATRRPSSAMLAGLDGIVVDLQDVGVRYYTYPSTMAYVMEAAAALKIRVFILDRPNPIGPAGPRGPLLDADMTSFTGYFPMPVQHGMTLGELALMFNTERAIEADLTIVPMKFYRRGDWFDQTGLAWINPSPNLRSVEEEILYPGTGMIEGGNVSVGRGTPRPFHLVGAPWIDGPALSNRLNGRAIAGVHFDPIDFTPDDDRYKNELCHGIRIIVTDRNALHAPALGIELACALHGLFGERFPLRPILSLVGSRAVLAAIMAGQDPRAIAAIWAPSLAAFEAMRAKYLIY